MLEVLCLAGILVVGDIGFNPDQIVTISPRNDYVYIYTTTRHSAEKSYPFGSKSAADLAARDIIIKWSECKGNKND